MEASLAGKTVVIVGGTSGIGLEAAAALADRGARVSVASRSESHGVEARARFGMSVDVQRLDASIENEARDYFARFEEIDHLVTTAAESVMAPFLEQSTADLRRLVDSKFWGQYHCARYAAPKIRAGGSITFFSGIVSRKPLFGASGFACVGGAVESLTRALALELAPIRVNCITPGVIDTPAWSFLGEGERRRQLRAFGDVLPAGRVGTAADVADLLLTVISNEFMTGAIVDIDGGHRVI